jgi:hypothetical protein
MSQNAGHRAEIVTDEVANESHFCPVAFFAPRMERSHGSAAPFSGAARPFPIRATWQEELGDRFYDGLLPPHFR